VTLSLLFEKQGGLLPHILNIIAVHLAFVSLLGCKAKKPEDSDVEMARGKLARGSESFLAPFVSLEMAMGGDFASSCSGVLLGPRHALTAAHCLDKILAARVTGYDQKLGKSSVAAGAWQMHPEWGKTKVKSGPERHKHDLGIVVLAKELAGPYAKIDASERSNLKNAVYVGIGRSEGNADDDKIRYATDIDTFRLKYKPDGGTWISRGAAILCSGDSGGPLFAGDGGLLGIAAAVAFEEKQKQDCGAGKRVYHADVRESIVWIVCSFAKAGYPLPNYPIPSPESCR
jgi:hypothetical protein